MKLTISIHKERRDIVQRKALPPPIVEEHCGTFFVSTFALGGGNGANFEASGRSPRELVERMRSKIVESEPDMERKRIPDICVKFTYERRTARRTLVGSEFQYDMTVRTEGLAGNDICEFFKAMDPMLDAGQTA
ncbi:hypothetical protein L0Y65_00315 [Candidatus Micrarchaeota archaeon]|nr:hypothetical protein [Candidatus Micrarchaeota archaeon]